MRRWHSWRRTFTAARTAVLLATLVAGAGLVGVQPSAYADSPVHITMTPSLFPTYSATVTDYVVSCTGSPVQVSVNAPAGYSVSVAGQNPATGSFVASVPLSSGQEFTLLVFNPDNTSTTGYVRCLPSDFPTTSPVTPDAGTSPQAQFYAVLPTASFSPAPAPYVALFDTHGVPVWWMNTVAAGGAPGIFGTFLPNGHVGWTTANQTGPALEWTLDGSLAHSISGINGVAEPHELVLLPNGDYLIGDIYNRPHIDLSSWGPSYSNLTDATIGDPVLEEISAGGAVVWSWDAYDHIPVTETDPQWRGTQFQGVYDPYHWNSLEADGNNYIASFRAMNAVLKISRATGRVQWKLGGTTRTDGTSLTINGDPIFAGGSGFGGQHDANLLPDGTVTLLDDGTGRGRPPRAVHYSITNSTKTATLLESVSDPMVTNEICCGSARKLPGGDWVTSWGGFNPLVTELTSSGQRAWGLNLPNGYFSYRNIPVLPGQVSIAALRAGMDTQWARPGISGTPTSPVNAGDPYSFAFTLRGNPTPTTSLIGGALPPGITLSPNGVLSGTPTQAGTYGAGVGASNGAGPDAATNFQIVVKTTEVLTPNSGPKTTPFNVHTTGFQSGEPVTVRYEASPTSSIVVCTGTASTDGHFDCGGTIPSGSAAGSKGAHVISAKGQTSGIKAKATFTVT